MLCYEVFLNGEKVALAGMTDWAVMSVIVSATRGDDDRDHHTLHIGGMSRQGDHGGYHARWKAPDLMTGSEILVRLIDCDEPDAPTKKYRSDKDVQESAFTKEESKRVLRVALFLI